MVDCKKILLTGAAVCVLCSAASGSTPVHSVKVISDNPVHIKPYQPAYVILDVDFDTSEGNGGLPAVSAALAKHVTVNGKSYGARMPGVNSVAMVDIKKGSIKTGDESRASVKAIVHMHWNVEDGGYLFDKPGSYEIQFGNWTAVSVIVDSPTKEEEALGSLIREQGAKFALRVGVEGPDGAPYAELLEEMIKQYPNTCYTPRLSVSLGMCKIGQVRGGPGVTLKEVLDEQAALASEYIDPHCAGSIQSPPLVRAAIRSAGIKLRILRSETDCAPKRAATLQREAIKLLEKVSESPYAIEAREEAAAALRKLRKADSPSEGAKNALQPAGNADE